MKNYLYKSLVTFVLLAQNLLFFAYDVEVNGIYYNLKTSAKTAEVTFMATNDGRYTVDVVIPTSINNSGTTYSVTSV